MTDRIVLTGAGRRGPEGPTGPRGLEGPLSAEGIAARDAAIAAAAAALQSEQNATDISNIAVDDDIVEALLLPGIAGPKTKAALKPALDVIGAPATAVLYVDPIGGSNAKTGRTWATALATLQAACDMAPKGAKIVLSGTSHDVGSGVTVDRTKCLTITGVNPLQGRQHADGTWNQARLISTATTKPAAMIETTTGTSNVYGWTFSHFYVDGASLAVGGAAIVTHGINRAHVEDVAGRFLLTSHTSGDDARYLVKADKGGADDASWWTIKDCTTYGMRGVLATNANYWTFPGSSFLGITGGDRPAGPAVYINGSQPNTNGLHVEGWSTAIKFENCRGPIAIGLGLEWVDTSIHMVGCVDGFLSVTSSAGGGNAEIIDENGTNNTVIGNTRVRRIGTTSRSFRASSRGTSPSQLTGDYISPIYGGHPTLPSPGREMAPGLGTAWDSALLATTAEYHDGAAWVPWSGLDTHPMHLMDTSGIDIDVTHKRFRFRLGNGGGPSPGLIYGAITQSNGTTGTVAVRKLDAGNVATSELITPLGDALNSPSQVRGFYASLALGNTTTIEVEFDLGLTGSQTAKLLRLSAYMTYDFSGALRSPGRWLTGRLTPEGRVTGRVGDYYTCGGTSDTDLTNPGIYRKVSGTGNTGWQRAVFIPTTPTVVSGSRGGNAALASLLTALNGYGLITDQTTA